MFYVGIYLTTAATLLFEVALVRVFSIALWHHFAFMVVSIAFLGYAASGSILMLFKRAVKSRTLLVLSPLFFSISAPICYCLANLIPFDPARFAWDSGQIFFIMLYYMVLSIPFVFSGMTVALGLAQRAEYAGRVYGADLLGAGTGAVLALGLFGALGAGVVFIPSAVAAVSSICLLLSRDEKATESKIFRKILIFAAISVFTATLVIVISRPGFMEVKISPYKALPFALEYEGAKVLETRWNSFSRVDLVESPAVRYAPGLSLKYTGELPAQLGITIDGNGLDAVTAGGPDAARLDFLDYLPTALPYRLLEGSGTGPTSVFLIDPGGGLPIVEAVRHLSDNVKPYSIDGAEKNPLVASMANDEFSGFIYDRARVKTGEGRAVLKANDTEYDLIYIGTSGHSASSSGFHGLIEDYTFTIEAISDYLDHLKPGGLFSVTVYLLPPPRGELKLVSIAVEALEGRGGPAASSMVVYRSLETMTMLVKNGPFTFGEIGTIKEFLAAMRFDVIHYPGMDPAEANVYNRFEEPLYYNLVKALVDKDSREALRRDYLFEINAPTDDRPFFHHFFKLRHLGEVIESVGGKWQVLLQGGYLLPLVLLQAIFLSALLIVLPALSSGWGRGGGLTAVLGYFFLLGIGFMFVEISLIQRFILYLGHPEYAFSAVVSALLVSCGVGSLLSQRMEPEKALKIVLPTLVALLGLLSLVVPGLIALTLGSALGVRIFLTIVIIAPTGVLLGMPFALAMRLLGTTDSASIPWAWAANGTASVMGSILAVMAAMVVGFKGVTIIAAGIYILALGSVLLAKKART